MSRSAHLKCLRIRITQNGLLMSTYALGQSANPESDSPFGAVDNLWISALSFFLDGMGHTCGMKRAKRVICTIRHRTRHHQSSDLDRDSRPSRRSPTVKTVGDLPLWWDMLCKSAPHVIFCRGACVVESWGGIGPIPGAWCPEKK